jgi:hypothetical protein
MLALEGYKQYLKKNNQTDKQYIVRSTNFIGQHQEYKGYLLEIKPSIPVVPFRPIIIERDIEEDYAKRHP